MATNAVSNSRSVRCVLVGTSTKNRFAIIPHKWPTKSRFFVVDSTTGLNAYDAPTVVCTVETAVDNKRGRRKDKTVTAGDVYGVVSALSEEEFEALDMMHATLTVVDIIPGFLEFVVKEPQGPVLKTLEIDGDGDSSEPPRPERSDELRILRDLGFGGARVLSHDVVPRTISVLDDDLHASVPVKSPETLEAETRALVQKYETALVTHLEKLVSEDRVARAVEADDIEVNVTLGIRNLRDWIVTRVELRIGTDEPRAIPERSLSSTLAEFEAVVTGVPRPASKRRKAREPRDADATTRSEGKRRRRSSSVAATGTADAVDDELQALQVALFGPRRIVDASLYVAFRAMAANASLTDEDKELLATLKIKNPDDESYDAEFVQQIHAFVSHDRALELLTDFVEADGAFVGMADELNEVRSRFLKSYEGRDEPALLRFQLAERAAADRDRRMLPARKAFRNLKRAFHSSS